ncbi:Csa1 family protein [Clostridium tertium]|uniref:Putative lipoprotein n=1 Tax=Clostridium tertium TaxID=1559 RepID=A0A6N3ESM6_9CLOT
MFIGNIRRILLFIMGLLIMTTITGCSNVFNRPSDKEIEGKFGEFVNMFPIEDLTVLYDKDGNRSNLKVDDLGTWLISTDKYSRSEKGREIIGIDIRFNRNTKESKGRFYKTIKNGEDVIEDIEYPIYYDKEGFHFIDENLEESLVEELSNFKMMYEYLSVGREYLDTLKAKEFYYNGEVPLYGATYKLTTEDKNIKKIKELYPEMTMDENNLTLDLEGHGTLWTTTGYVTFNIFLDDKHNNYFTAMMAFEKSDEFQESISGK